MELTPTQQKKLKKLQKVAEKGNFGVLELIDELEEKIEEIKAAQPDLSKVLASIRGNDGYTPQKGVDYEDGHDADEDSIVEKVVARIPAPKPGKDADESKIVKNILKRIPKPEPLDYDSLVERVLDEIPTPEPAPAIVPLRATEIRDLLETLPEEERIRRQALLGGDDLVDREELNRAIEILDKRTQYLINKKTSAGGLQSVVGGTNVTIDNTDPNNPIINAAAGSVSIFSDTLSGLINGSNTVFTTANNINSAIVSVLANSSYQPGVDFTVTGAKQITYAVAPDASLSGQPHWLSHT